MASYERLMGWLGTLGGWVASAGYFLLSVVFHRGYFDYLPTGAKVWVERKVWSQADAGPRQASTAPNE
jgi:hypothetical protein